MKSRQASPAPGHFSLPEHEGIEPDVIVTAKGIAGGLPLSAVTGRANIMNSAHPGGLGGTYAGNPIACAAALATIETYRAENLIDRARELETLFRGQLNAMRVEDSRIGDVRGRGAMLAIELVDPSPASQMRRSPAGWPPPHTHKASSC